MTNSAHSHRNPSSLDNWTATTLVVSALVSLAVLTAACSDQSAAPTPTIELAPTSTPVTTEAPTSEVPTTTQAPPTTEDPRIAEIEAAVAASRDLQVEVLTNPEISVERMEEVTTGRALEATIRNTLSARAERQEIVGDFTGVPISTEITSAVMATHLQCGLDALAAFSPNGELLVPADDTAFLLRYELELDGSGNWLVELVSFEGAEEAPCDL